MNLAPPLAGPIHPPEWVRPPGNTDFKVTQPFGCTGVPAERPLGSCAHFHRGDDFGNGHCGAIVKAAGSGKVCFSATLPDGANCIWLDHGGGWVTGYFHLAVRSVAKGATVAQGQAIGTLGDTGNSTACHLHFGVKSGANPAGDLFSDANGTWQDPWPLMQGGDMLAVQTTVPLETPNPRVFEIGANVIVNGYDPAQPNKVVKSYHGTLPSTGMATATCFVSWPGTVPAPIPRGGPFLLVSQGYFAGLLIAAGLVTLAPPAAPTPGPIPSVPLAAGAYSSTGPVRIEVS